MKTSSRSPTATALELQSLDGDVQLFTVRESGRLSFAPHRQASDDLVMAVRTAAAAADCVDAVYVLQAESPSGSHLALGVVLAGGGYRRLTGRTLAEIMPADLGLVLNPGGELGLPLQAEEVLRLTSVGPPENGESEFLLGEPRAEPTALLDTIARVAECRPDVRAAYRALLVRRPGAEPEHVIGLKLSAQADSRDAIDAAAEAAGGASVDRLGLIPLQPGVDIGQIGRFMLSQTKPFWVRADAD